MGIGTGMALGFYSCLRAKALAKAESLGKLDIKPVFYTFLFKFLMP
jgi:hypothetical protein